MNCYIECHLRSSPKTEDSYSIHSRMECFWSTIACALVLGPTSIMKTWNGFIKYCEKEKKHAHLGW